MNITEAMQEAEKWVKYAEAVGYDALEEKEAALIVLYRELQSRMITKELPADYREVTGM